MLFIIQTHTHVLCIDTENLTSSTHKYPNEIAIPAFHVKEKIDSDFPVWVVRSAEYLSFSRKENDVTNDYNRVYASHFEFTASEFGEFSLEDAKSQFLNKNDTLDVIVNDQIIYSRG